MARPGSNPAIVITKGYGVRATTIEGRNAFAPSLCFAYSLRSKRFFCSRPNFLDELARKRLLCRLLCVSLTRQIVKTRVIRLRVMEGPNARGQVCVLCISFHSFLMDD